MYAEINENLFGKISFLPAHIGQTKNQINIFRPMGFHHHHIIWVTEGYALFKANGEEKVLTKGQGLLCRQGAPHSYEKVEGDFSTRWVAFSGGDDILDYYGVRESLFFENIPFLDAETDELEAMCHHITPPQRAAHTNIWITKLLEAATEEKISKITLAEQFMESNFDRQIGLDDIAEHVGMSKYSICHLYSKEKGETLIQTLKKIRVQKAKIYILNSQLPIEEIGKMCGFGGGSYFSKTFKEFEKISPSEYRQKY